MSGRNMTVLTIAKPGRIVRLIEIEHRSYTIELNGRPVHSGEEDLGRALRVARRYTEEETDAKKQ